MANDVRNKKTLISPVVMLSIAAVVGIALLFGAIITEPQKKAALKRFYSTPPSEVTQIVLRSISPSSPMNAPVVLSDPNEISNCLAVIRRSTETSLNHPLIEWECEIEIVTASGSSKGTISATSNQGVLLQIHTGVPPRFYRNDDLAILIKSLSSPRVNPNSQ